MFLNSSRSTCFDFCPFYCWRVNKKPALTITPYTRSAPREERYIDEPDATLHVHGFYDGELQKTLTKLDDVFKRLIDEMQRQDLLKEVNIILAADHGHAQVGGMKNIVCVPDYVKMDRRRVKLGENSIYTHDKAYAQEIYNNLTKAVKENGLKIKVYTKNDFPNHHFYKGRSSRIGDVIVEADVGYVVDLSCTRILLKWYNSTIYEYANNTIYNSNHGQDPANLEMNAILAFSGPDIGSNHK
ncbi:hypothetical protein TELCIR_13009, partial [Teladorsagia circumcincta]